MIEFFSSDELQKMKLGDDLDRKDLHIVCNRVYGGWEFARYKDSKWEDMSMSYFIPYNAIEKDSVNALNRIDRKIYSRLLKAKMNEFVYICESIYYERVEDGFISTYCMSDGKDNETEFIPIKD